MTTQATLTVISGIVLLLVFVLVGWKLRRRHGRHGHGRRSDER